nr:sodium-dependent transporter [Tissierella sp.]
MEKREGFSSKFGILAAAVGSAIGLGNIWRFPYVVGKYGGGAFLIIYLAIVAVIGLPLMLSEFIIGREAKLDAIGSFKKLDRRPFFISGVLGVLAAFFILSFYGVVAGWTLEYVFSSVMNKFAGQDSQAIEGMFTGFIADPYRPIMWQIVFMTITGIIVSTGVQKGIEKVSKIMVPLLLVLIIILDIKALSLPNSMEGIKFLFQPDFSKIDARVILAALGHAFFSLSLGMGIMITYGSYIQDKEKLGSMAVQISIADTLIALLAGIAIFPAVFAYGIDPSGGPGLVFITLPNVFSQMSGGYFFSILFFLLLALAALTSTISLLEVVVAFLVDSMKMARRKASILAFGSITLVGFFASLSNGPLKHLDFFGNNFFDFLDETTANYFLTTAALISVVFVGWFMKRDRVDAQLSNEGEHRVSYEVIFYGIIRYLAPVGIVLVFLYQLGLFGEILN